jgi:hypothetical protein
VIGEVFDATAAISSHELTLVRTKRKSSCLFLPSLSQISHLLCRDLSFVFSEQNGIAGTLPFEINRLQSLRFLLLEEGILTGTIPSEIGDIRSLESIDLNFNLLTGTIPETIYSLPFLKQLDLNDNEFVGTISTAIGQLSSLNFFQIEHNRMTGTVPTELGRLQLLGKREKGEILLLCVLFFCCHVQNLTSRWCVFSLTFLQRSPPWTIICCPDPCPRKFVETVLGLWKYSL